MGALLRRPASGTGRGSCWCRRSSRRDYLQFSAERLARLGYGVLAPDLYWRIQAAADISDNDLDTAMQFIGDLDPQAAVGDLIATLGHLRDLDEAVDRVEAAAADLPNAWFERYPTGGHAFDNAFSEQFHQPRNALMAWAHRPVPAAHAARVVGAGRPHPSQPLSVRGGVAGRRGPVP